MSLIFFVKGENEEHSPQFVTCLSWKQQREDGTPLVSGACGATMYHGTCISVELILKGQTECEVIHAWIHGIKSLKILSALGSHP